MSYLSHLECALCGKHYNADELQTLCPECQRPLLARYDLETAKCEWDRDSLEGREANMWRYREVLPVRDQKNAIKLGEGYTPILHATRLGESLGMQSLFIKDESWKIVGPTEKGPQKWGVGGELAIWHSTDQGKTWEMMSILTENSEFSHSYVRRPVNFKAPFCFFWANGHSHKFSISELYFGNFDGDIWKLPYDMKNDFEKPLRIK